MIKAKNSFFFHVGLFLVLPVYYIYFFLIIPTYKLSTYIPNFFLFLYFLFLTWNLQSKETHIWSKKKLRILVRILYSIFFLHVAVLQINHYESFFLGDNDVVSITEVLFETARGNLFKSHHFGNSETENFLSHHFSPGLVIFLPFIFLFPIKMIYPFSLLFFSFLGMIIYEKIVYVVIPKKFPYLIFGILPLSNPTLYDLLTSYHFEILYFPFFMLLMYGFLKKSTPLQLLSLMGCLGLKEDIPLYIGFYFFFLGINQLIKKNYFQDFNINKIKIFPKISSRSSLYNSFFYYILISIIGFSYFLSISKIQSRFDDTSKVNWLISWSKYGTTKYEIFKFFLYNPQVILKIFLENMNIFIKLVADGGFLIIFSFPEFFSFLIIFIIQTGSSRIWYNQFYNYYSYTVIPLLLSGSVLGFRKISNYREKKWILLPLLGVSLYSASQERRFPQHYRDSNENKIAILRDVIAKIPPNSRVSSQFYLGMFLEGTHSAYPLQKESNKEFILVDTEGMSPYIQIDNLIKRLEKNEKYFEYYSNQTVKLYRKLD